MTAVNVEEQTKMLLELQELDSEVLDKKNVLKFIPEKVKQLDAELESKSASLKCLEEELKKVQLVHKEKEGDLQTKEEAIKKHQSQLSQIKTNKEYTALQKEIDSLKADSSLLEEDIINSLDKIDEIKKNIAKEKEIFEIEKNKTGEDKKKMEVECKKAEAEYNDLSNKRKEFASKIDRSILSKYDRILHNKNGLAMVPVVSNACGGCNMNLPPQVINEARLRRELVFCGNCARILYSKE